jgi:hypothetical protein
VVQIKIKSDSLPAKYVENGLQFEDGSTLPADLIVFATGFEHNLKNQVGELFSPSIADKMGDWWGLNDEGEIRGAFRPCGRKSFPPLIRVGCFSIDELSRERNVVRGGRPESKSILFTVRGAEYQG